jgi:ATP-binding cassette, subfamily B, bacterial
VSDGETNGNGARTRSPRLGPAVRMAGGFVWRAAPGAFLVSLLAEVVGALALGGVLLFGRQLVGELTGQPPVDDLGEVLPATVGLGTALVVSGVAAVVARQTRWLVAEQVSRHVEEEIIAVSTSVDYETYERQDFHDHLNRANSRAAESSYELVYALLSLANLLATSVVVVGVLIGSVPEMLGALVLIAVPAILAARASARLAFQTSYELTPDDRLRFYVYRVLTGRAEARELRVFGLAEVLRGRWDALYDERVRRIRALVRRDVLFNGLAALIGAVLVAGVLLVLVQSAVDGRIGLDDAAVAIVALQQLTTRLRSAAGSSGSVRQSTLFLDDFDSFRQRRSRSEPRARLLSSRPRDHLAVEHVSFRYPGTEAVVLDDVSLDIAPGEIVALVGESGSGKTTLAHLVAGLYQPTAGRITFGGVDIAAIPQAEYWRSLAVVFQEFVRYELTARENVAMSDHARAGDLAAVQAAAERAGIDRALAGLASGYDTMMSRAYERGADLSVGQWQRVAVARAFFRDAPLLILDEPAAALDAMAEQRLYERLVELCERRSVLLISHRFSTVRLADRICVMHEGRIVEQGTHRELMARAGRYAAMFTLQASAFRDSGWPNGEQPVSPGPDGDGTADHAGAGPP